MPGVMFHSYNPSIWGRGGPVQVQRQPSLCSVVTTVTQVPTYDSVSRHCLHALCCVSLRLTR